MWHRLDCACSRGTLDFRAAMAGLGQLGCAVAGRDALKSLSECTTCAATRASLVSPFLVRCLTCECRPRTHVVLVTWLELRGCLSHGLGTGRDMGRGGTWEGEMREWCLSHGWKSDRGRDLQGPSCATSVDLEIGHSSSNMLESRDMHEQQS